MDMQDKDDRYYIKKVLDGESSAFAYLVDRYKHMAYNISLRIVRQSEDAEDVTQDSFVKAYRFLKGFKGDSKFSTWLYRIVYNTSVSHMRKKQSDFTTEKTDGHILEYADFSGSIESNDDEIIVAALKRAMDDLTVEEQTMVALYYYDKNSIDDIAGIMSLSVSNVKVKLFRARKKLKDLIPQFMKNTVSAD